MDPATVLKALKMPMKNLTSDNITENVIAINSGCPNRRNKFLMERLVTHLHDFARETRLSTKEWMATLEFLTDCGKMCTETRQVKESLVDNMITTNHD
jgi:Catechol dioxygenase N terminus